MTVGEAGAAGKSSAFAKAVSWLLVAAWAVFIFAASAKSGFDYESGVGVLAQVKQWLGDVLTSLAGQPVDPSPIGHFTEFLMFGALLANALAATLPGGADGLCAAASSVAIAAVYAASDEFHQLFVPGRACDPADWAVDVVAAAIGTAVVLAVLRRRVHRRGA